MSAFELKQLKLKISDQNSFPRNVNNHTFEFKTEQELDMQIIGVSI
jgi:hypothetical protein